MELISEAKRSGIDRIAVMKISKWWIKKKPKALNVSHIELPEDLANEEAPGKRSFFKEIRSCSILCTAAILFYGRAIR